MEVSEKSSVPVVVESQFLSDLDVFHGIEGNVIAAITVHCLGLQVLAPIIAVVDEPSFIALVSSVNRSFDPSVVGRVEVVE